ncbi:MAG: MerR family DNA-binding transcriptional regulator [Acidimicrobiales bacterium]
MSSARTAADQDLEGELLNIGEVARRAGVSSRTIRYYEELGILPEPPRSEKGTRKYPLEYVTYLRWALTLKQLDFPLEEVRILAPVGRGRELDGDARATAASLIEERIADLESKIDILRILAKLVDGSAVADTTTINVLLRAAGSTQTSNEAVGTA